MLFWGNRNYYYSFDYESYLTSTATEVPSNHFEVMDALEPFNNLKALQIILYRGDKFPFWVTEYQVLQNLREMYIIECRECTQMPPVEKLPFLRVLGLKCLDTVSHLCSCASTSIEGAEYGKIAFPSLEEMQLSEMPNLCSWWEGELGEDTSMSFTKLKTLGIFNCPVLTAMPAVPLLEKLSLSIGGLTSLEELCIKNCPNLADLPEGMERLKALAVLEISNCPKIKVFPEGLLQQLEKLDRLWIEGCPHLERHFGMFGKHRRLISEIQITKIGKEGKSRILRDLESLVPSCKIDCFSAQS